jgi:Ca2+-transporting ATPase
MTNSWHALDNATVMNTLHTTEQGLSEEEAKKRLQQEGPNTIHIKSRDTLWIIFLRQWQNPIIYVLLFATALSLLLQKWPDSIVVFSVILLNTFIGFFQEYRAHETIKALSALTPHYATVIRSSETKKIAASHVVPGDILLLQEGDLIAADLRLLFSKHLHCDESSLTGESLPIPKRIDPLPEDTLLADQTNRAFKSTYVTSGTGFGVVIATGRRSEIGKISEWIEQIPSLETPLSATIKKIAQAATIGILGISLLLFLIGYLRGTSLFNAAFAAITLAVAAVPEGLPAVITIASAIGVRRMARRNVIIRQLPAVEALGSTNIICTDKTGTLTHNEMTVQQLWTPSGTSFVTGAGYSLKGQIHPSHSDTTPELEQLLTAALLCSDATLEESHKGNVPIGDPTEVSMVVAGRKIGLHERHLRSTWNKRDQIPFESKRRLMATLYTSPSHEHILIMKGAPEEITQACPSLNIEDEIHSMAKQGMRVLAVAQKKLSSPLTEITEHDIVSGFTLLGLIGIVDPIRKEAYQAIKTCHEAHITVKMVTGDHPITAEAVSRELGILGKGNVITGTELNAFSEAEWKHAAHANHVFARVSPKHKLKLVEILQASGHVVAMTGDGVNDAAALKRADIGISMGIKGTAFAKEASDMILTDDNFASIEAAVVEGRRVYDNLIKSLQFLIPTSLGLACVVLIAVLFFPIKNGIPLHPISPLQVLWINLIVAVSLSLPLAFESEEPHLMKRPPKKKNAPILSGWMLLKPLTVSLLMALGTVALFYWQYQSEISRGILAPQAQREAQSMAVTAMIFFQIFYLFHCRTFKTPQTIKSFFSNPTIFIGVSAVILAQAAFLYLPVMNTLFRSSPLSLKSLLISCCATFLVVPLIACEKLLVRKQIN